MKTIKVVIGVCLLLLIGNYLWNIFFQKTYVCRDEDEMYFLTLGAYGKAIVYDKNKNIISSTKYYNVDKNRFVGENGWEGWPGTEPNSMIVDYRDKNGKPQTFYKGCLLKK